MRVLGVEDVELLLDVRPDLLASGHARGVRAPQLSLLPRGGDADELALAGGQHVAQCDDRRLDGPGQRRGEDHAGVPEARHPLVGVQRARCRQNGSPQRLGLFLAALGDAMVLLFIHRHNVLLLLRDVPAALGVADEEHVLLLQRARRRLLLAGERSMHSSEAVGRGRRFLRKRGCLQQSQHLRDQRGLERSRVRGAGQRMAPGVQTGRARRPSAHHRHAATPGREGRLAEVLGVVLVAQFPLNDFVQLLVQLLQPQFRAPLGRGLRRPPRESAFELVGRASAIRAVPRDPDLQLRAPRPFVPVVTVPVSVSAGAGGGGEEADVSEVLLSILCGVHGPASHAAGKCS
mmetsp:Transcript_39055/g.112130  ORF Transcript_39055/g.112130 Transcript_39055/m.112130 type:complete len:347 (+) Transcript_39055:512-1552(+)